MELERMSEEEEVEHVQILIDMKRYDDAEAILNETIIKLQEMSPSTERDNTLAKAFNNMGYILYKKVEFREAVEFYSKSLEMNSLFAPAYYNRAVIRYRLGSFDSAHKDFIKAVQLEPDNLEFLAGLQDNSNSMLPGDSPHSKTLLATVSDNEELSKMKRLLTKCSNDLEKITRNQKTMWGVLNESLEAGRRLEGKIDSLLTIVKEEKGVAGDSSQDIAILSSLPVGIPEFAVLEAKLVESISLRQSLRKLMSASYGKDSKSLAANILRRVMSDDLGECFSLTGRAVCSSSKLAAKQPFEKTEVYRLILETCFDTLTNCKEKEVREAISDWLMQAKFRKNRRLQRRSAREED